MLKDFYNKKMQTSQIHLLGNGKINIFMSLVVFCDG